MKILQTKNLTAQHLTVIVLFDIIVSKRGQILIL